MKQHHVFSPFFVSNCATACQNNTYGAGCSESCGHCVDGKQCYHVNGACHNGCKAGYFTACCITGKLPRKKNRQNVLSLSTSQY